MMNVSVRTLALAVLAAMTAFARPLPVDAQSAPAEITFGSLGATSAEWPMFIAEAQGFYKDEGISVTIVRGTSPPSITSMVATGEVDLAANGCDSEFVAVAHQLPIEIVGTSFSTNPYSLVVLPNIKSWADLKGKSVMLATKQDVTAIVFGSLAAAQHLKLDDFSIIIGGSSAARYAGLVSGNVQGSMLMQPFDLEAEAKGYPVLATASDTIKDWSFGCFLANTDWAQKNRSLVVKFLRAVHRGMEYGYTHKDRAVAVFVNETKIDPAIAVATWDLDFGKWKAFDPTLRLTAAAAQAVGKYQVDLGIIPALPPMKSLYDPSYAAEAVK